MECTLLYRLVPRQARFASTQLGKDNDMLNREIMTAGERKSPDVLQLTSGMNVISPDVLNHDLERFGLDEKENGDASTVFKSTATELELSITSLLTEDVHGVGAEQVRAFTQFI